MTFVPTDYKEPSSGGGGRYLKIATDQTVRLRILSATPVMGWEYWTNNNKPRRLHEMTDTPTDLRRDAEGKQEKPRFFWSMAVWNTEAEVVQIWTITQAKIRKAIQALCEDSDYGDPIGYDIKVTRKGATFETTEYTVLPGRASLFENHAAIAEASAINWKAWMCGEDPFTTPATSSPSAPATTPNDWAKEFWALMKSAQYSEDQAKQVLMTVGAIDSSGNPSTANMTEYQYSQAMQVVGEADIPF
jgi:hypothetical protein